VDIKGVMDGLRRMAVRQGIRPKAQVRNLEKAFQDNIKGFGRVYEPGVVLDFNIRSGNLLHDVIFFPWLLIKRKISLLPHFKRTAEVRKVLRKATQITKKAQEVKE
jgi:heterodisulfide reductase subunit C